MSDRDERSGREEPRSEAAPGFSEAMAEVESILRRIEAESIDIDDLADELRRASELLEIARGKIRRAEVEVTQIVQSLAKEPPGDAGPAREEARAGDAEDDGDAALDGDQDDIPF